MAGKAFRKDTRIQKIFRKENEIKRVYFKDTEVFSSAHLVVFHIDVDNETSYEIEDGTDIISQAPEATKEGWDFVGWRTDNVPSPDVYEELICEDDGIEVYAVFTQLLYVTLEGGDSTIVQEGSNFYNNGVESGADIVLRDNSLDGWESLVGYTTTIVAGPDVDYIAGNRYTFPEDTTIYADFFRTATLYYTIQGVQDTTSGPQWGNNGVQNNPTVYVEDPTYEGTDFRGWSDSAGSITIVNTSLADGLELVDANTYRYAVWKWHNATLGIATSVSGWSWNRVVQDIATSINGTRFSQITIYNVLISQETGNTTIGYSVGYAGLQTRAQEVTLRGHSNRYNPSDPEDPEIIDLDYPCKGDTRITCTLNLQNRTDEYLQLWADGGSWNRGGFDGNSPASMTGRTVQY